MVVKSWSPGSSFCKVGVTIPALPTSEGVQWSRESSLFKICRTLLVEHLNQLLPYNNIYQHLWWLMFAHQSPRKLSWKVIQYLILCYRNKLHVTHTCAGRLCAVHTWEVSTQATAGFPPPHCLRHSQVFQDSPPCADLAATFHSSTERPDCTIVIDIGMPLSKVLWVASSSLLLRKPMEWAAFMGATYCEAKMHRNFDFTQ